MYVSTSSGSAKNKNKIADACPAVAAAVAAANAKPTANKKIDDFKVVNEPKKRFFSRPFQRFSSTPPMSTSVPAPEAAVKTRKNNIVTPKGSPSRCIELTCRSRGFAAYRFSSQCPAESRQPPLSPQTKPRTIHACKNYLKEEQQQQPPPPENQLPSSACRNGIKITLGPVLAVPLLPAAGHRLVFFVAAIITVAVLSC